MPNWSPTERVALIARLDTRPTKADWAAYSRGLDAMPVSGTS